MAQTDAGGRRSGSIMTKITPFLIVVMCACFALTTAHAENRIALVIGNATYDDAPLANPKNDAELMTATLQRVGFEVTTLIDADQRAMKRAMIAFGRKLRGSDDVGLFYYAGHGMQVDGENFLIPVDAVIGDELEVPIEGVSINEFLRTMQRASSRINIVILDACRNNPFARSFRSATRGLARVDAPSGTYVAYATSPGAVAYDGNTGNSPYTTALSHAITQPGVPIEQVFKTARRAVLTATKDQQVPWETSSITGQFYFQKPVNAAPAKTLVQTNDGHELAFWNAIKDSKDPAVFEAYIKQYPSGSFTALAEVMKSRAEVMVKRETQLAALPEKAEPEPEADLPRKIQQKLADAGCRPGKVDGVWGRNSRAALKRFAKYAQFKLPEKLLSGKTLGMLEQHPGRICPEPPKTAAKPATKQLVPTAQQPQKRRKKKKKSGFRTCEKYLGVEPTACDSKEYE